MKKLALVLGITGIAVLALSLGAASAAQMTFETTLSGDQEVPPVVTGATGSATFTLSADGKELDYTVTVGDIENVDMAHLHLGKAGENGPVVVWLYPSSQQPEVKAGYFTGILAQGKLTASDFVDKEKFKTMDDLIKAIQAGDIYVNVHTTQNPDGELRGQLQ